MPRPVIDLRAPPVTVNRQPDPQIPTIEFSEVTRGALIKTLGKELAIEAITAYNNFSSTNERVEQTARFTKERSSLLEGYKERMLKGEDVNALFQQGEADIKNFFASQRKGVHGTYWANILEKEALAKNRVDFAMTISDDARVKQGTLINQDFKTQWLRTDTDPSHAPEAFNVIERLAADYLRNTGDAQATAVQKLKWQDEIGVTAVRRAAEASIQAGENMFNGVVDNLSLEGTKQARAILESAARIHEKRDLQDTAMQESRARVNAMMEGRDSEGNPVFIDPSNKQSQQDMNNDYALTKLEEINNAPSTDYVNAAKVKAIRSYAEKVRRTGIIPDDYASDLRSHLNSGDPGLMKRAASDIESITRSGMKMSRQLSEEMIADSVTIMRWARSGVSDEILLDRVKTYQKERYEQHEAREKSYKTILTKDKKEEYLKDVTKNTFVRSLFDFEGRFLKSTTAMGEFEVQATDAVRRYYIHNGMNMEDAKDAAAKDLRQSWGITRTMSGDKDVMLYPPEMAYPGPYYEGIEKFQGKHWSAIALQEEMKEWQLKKQYDPRRVMLTFETTDVDTERVLYRLMYRNEHGGLEELMSKRDGVYQPILWYPGAKYYLDFKRKMEAPTPGSFEEAAAPIQTLLG